MSPSRTYAVTGAASGIGAITTGQLRADGHTVITVDLKDADVSVDLTTDEGRTNLATQVERLSGGTLDGVVACAGLSAPIVATAAVNYFGAVATLRACVPCWRGQRRRVPPWSRPWRRSNRSMTSCTMQRSTVTRIEL